MPLTDVGCASSCSDLKEINEAKVANILAYLDEAVGTSQSCSFSTVPLTASALHNATDTSVAVTPSLPSSLAVGGVRPIFASAPAYSVASGIASAQTTYIGIKKRIESLQSDNEDLRQENDALRQRLADWRSQDEARRVEVRESVSGEVSELRQALAAAKKRAAQQLAKASEEKDQLQRSVDALSSQLRQEMLRRDEERQQLESAHTTAVGAMRAKWQAQEKAAREKWRIAEAKRIKESTLQSLEPDIVLLLNRHKAEKARMREEYENELRRRDEAIAAQDASVEELKAKLQRDAESALSREQSSFQTRLRDEVDRVRRQLEDERRTEGAKRAQMESFFEEEKAALQREVARLGREALELRRVQTTGQANFHEAVATEVARVTGQSTDMLASLKEKLMLEFTCREKEAGERNAKYLAAKEEELRRRCDVERDAAVEKVVRRLEEEHVRAMTSSRDTDGLFRERYSQLARDNERLKMEAELMREQLREAAAARQRHEQETAALREKTNLSDDKIKAIEDRVRAQFAARVEVLDSVWQGRLSEIEGKHAKESGALMRQVESTGRELEQQRQQAEQEKRSVEQRHNAELHQINERVLVAMTQKDTTLRAQAEQLLSLQEALEVREKELERHKSLLLQ